MRKSLLALPFALTAPLLLLGCAGSGGPATLDGSIAAYDRGEYTRSLEMASSVATSSDDSAPADEAAYLAGMSAFRLERWTEAERWLAKASRSTDRWLASQAAVTLGSAQTKLGKQLEAARSFSRAAELMDGEDAKRARIAAANAYRAAGNDGMADAEFRKANVPVTTMAAPPPVGGSPMARGSGSPPSATSTGSFVLQAGAFKDASKARTRADQLRGRAVQLGYGEPRVLTKRGTDGATLFVVQFGHFSDRRSADSAVGRFGESGVVVSRAVAGG